MTEGVSSIPLLSLLSSLVSIWCALPTSRKLTVREKATSRHTPISLHQRSPELITRENMGSDTSKSKKRATQLTEEEIQLLLKNTHFNRQQIKEWHQGFLVSNSFLLGQPIVKCNKFRIILHLIKKSIQKNILKKQRKFCYFYFPSNLYSLFPNGIERNTLVVD